MKTISILIKHQLVFCTRWFHFLVRRSPFVLPILFICVILEYHAPFSAHWMLPCFIEKIRVACNCWFRFVPVYGECSECSTKWDTKLIDDQRVYSIVAIEVAELTPVQMVHSLQIALSVYEDVGVRRPLNPKHCSATVLRWNLPTVLYHPSERHHSHQWCTSFHCLERCDEACDQRCP